MPTEVFQTLLGPTPNDLYNVTMTQITATQIQEMLPTVHPPEALLQPSTVLHINQAFRINLQWDVSGRLANTIGGNWDLHAYLEHMGDGPDLDLTDPNDHLIPLQAGNLPHHYHKWFDVPAGIVAHDGAYKLFATLTYINLAGVPDQMAGYWEGPILQFYR